MTSKVKICPNCASEKLSETKSSLGGWLVPASYHCEECRYSGQVYVEVDAEELKKLRDAMNGQDSD